MRTNQFSSRNYRSPIKNSFYVRFCPVIENFALNIVISKFPYSPDKQWLKEVLPELYMTSLCYRLPFFLPLFSKNIIIKNKILFNANKMLSFTQITCVSFHSIVSQSTSCRNQKQLPQFLSSDIYTL